MDINKLDGKLVKEDIDKALIDIGKLQSINKLKLNIAAQGRCSKCVKCSERKTFVWPEGNVNSKIMFIASPDVNVNGYTPLTNLGGVLFTVVLNKLGINRDNLYTTSVSKCNLNDEESMEYCFNVYLAEEINIVKPKCIITMGEIAANILRDYVSDTHKEKEDLDDIKDKPYKVKIADFETILFHILDPNIIIEKNGLMYNNYKSKFWQELNYCINTFK